MLWRLLKGADVFLRGFRPGVIGRLGFDYASVSAREPRLLTSRSRASARVGPLAERPAMDPVLQAYTGLMSENRGEDGIPHRVPVIVVDMSTALYAFRACRLRSMPGATRRVALSRRQPDAGGDSLQSIRLMACHPRGGTMKPGGVPGGVFKIADGWMSLVAINDRDWRALCGAMELPALADDARFDSPAKRLANDVALYAIVRPALAAKPWTEWNRRLTEARLMHERLNSYAEFLEQPHVQGNRPDPVVAQAGLNRPCRCRRCRVLPPVDGTPAPPRRSPPAHAGDPWPNTATAGAISMPCWRTARWPPAHERSKVTSLGPQDYRPRHGRTAAASTDIAHAGENLALQSHADHGPGPFSDYAGFDRAQVLVGGTDLCSRRRTARSTCGRRSSRCASPASSPS